MKRFSISILLLTVMLLGGCIAESAYCPLFSAMDNLTVEFVYPDGGRDVFGDKIHRVDLFVFDSRGNYVTELGLDRNSLSEFAGANLSLDPGTYRIVCWANASEKSRFVGTGKGNTFADAYITAKVDESSFGAEGDPLHYAPRPTGKAFSKEGFLITVPAEGSARETMEFAKAHVSVSVYIKGFEDRSPEGVLLTPVVEKTDVLPMYNFNFEKSGDPVSFRSVSTLDEIDGEPMAVATFSLPLFGEDTPMRLLVKKQSDGYTVTEVILADFIRENDISIEDSVDFVLPILLEYKGGSVSVSLPNWEEISVGPER